MQNYNVVVGDVTIEVKRLYMLIYITIHRIQCTNGCAKQRQPKEKCMGVLEAFDYRPLADNCFLLCFHWVCDMVS